MTVERRRTIDNSLKERHDILHLLKKVKRDDVTFDEMDDIGRALKKAGKRALSPLIRLLWKETDGELLSKYAYLLDFFEEEPWLDQLVQVALRRTDLDSTAKSAILGALQDYGVDISTPPFIGLMDEFRGPLSETLPRLLDRGEEGLILFTDDFIQFPHEMQLAILQELPQIRDGRVLEVLEILMGLENPALVAEAVASLSKIRERAAADILARTAASADAKVRELCVKGLRRLAFVGINPDPEATRVPLSPFHVSWVSPLDGAGYRTLWFARWRGEGELGFICLHLHETTGVRAAWGSGKLSVKEFDDLSRERVEEEGLVRIPFKYAFDLLRDALFRNRETLFALPAEYYVLKNIFTGENIEPVPYIPDFSVFDLNTLSLAKKHLAAGAALFDDDFFAGWYMATCRVYDFAEEWIALEKDGGAKSVAVGLDAILERFCRELLAPQVEQLRNRLLLTADLLLKTAGSKASAEVIVANALSLGNFSMPYHLHPFLRQLAIESMDAAREALAEGYDLRDYPHEADDDEWWD